MVADGSAHGLMLAVLVWIIFLELATPLLSDFAARKLCHAGCGFLMMSFDPADAHSQWFVWSVAAGSIAMTWNLTPLPAFRFARAHDVGVTACALGPPPALLAITAHPAARAQTCCS